MFKPLVIDRYLNSIYVVLSNNPSVMQSNECSIVQCLQVQEFRTGANRQNVDSVHAKEETIRLRSQFNELQSKLNDLQARVRINNIVNALRTLFE